MYLKYPIINYIFKTSLLFSKTGDLIFIYDIYQLALLLPLIEPGHPLDYRSFYPLLVDYRSFLPNKLVRVIVLKRVKDEL